MTTSTKVKTVRAAAYAPDGTEIPYTSPPNKWDVAGIAQRVDSGKWVELAHGNSYDSVRRRALTQAYRGPYIPASVTAVRIWEATAPCVREYFGHHKLDIARVFRPGSGWEDVKLHGGWSNIRKLSLQGVTSIEFRLVSERDRRGVTGYGDAQFQMAELLASMRLPKQRMCATRSHDHIPATQKVTYRYVAESPRTEFVCGACAEIMQSAPDLLAEFAAAPLAR